MNLSAFLVLAVPPSLLGFRLFFNKSTTCILACAERTSFFLVLDFGQVSSIVLLGVWIVWTVFLKLVVSVQAAHVLFSWIGGGFFVLFLSNGSSSALAVACAFSIVLKSFLAVFNVLAWPPSFKIESFSHDFGIFFGIILHTISRSVNLTAFLSRSRKRSQFSQSSPWLSCQGVLGFTEVLVLFLVHVISKDLPDETLCLVSKGGAHPIVMVPH